MTRTEWEQELAYIKALAERGHDGTAVPANLVATYIDMQERGARREGHGDIAAAIAQIDTARQDRRRARHGSVRP